MTLDRLAQPLVLEPKPEARVWGGRRLEELLGRSIPEGPVGESWEIHGQLQVADGPWRGRTLDSLVAERGSELLGRRGQDDPSFPLLTKWLDCRDWLSVQVHPDDALAAELSGDPSQRGKSEAWYIAQCDPEATLIHGLAPQATVEQIAAAQGEAILALLGKQQPAPETLLFTGAGTVHALGPGFLIYEVQQSSDLTYRLYDWGRDRPIHPEASLRCMKEATPIPCRRDDQGGLSCRYFNIEVMNGPGSLHLDGDSFAILAVMQGAWRLQGEFEERALGFGDSILLPACLGTVRISGEGKILKISLGDGKP